MDYNKQANPKNSKYTSKYTNSLVYNIGVIIFF